MNISKKQLKKIILEELEIHLNEHGMENIARNHAARIRSLESEIKEVQKVLMTILIKTGLKKQTKYKQLQV